MVQGIKNIIFDFGGVLLNIDFELTEQQFVNLGITDFGERFSKAKQTRLFDRFETGKMSENEFCEELRKTTQTNLSDTSILSAWNSMLLDFPLSRKKMLEALGKDYRLFLLSNTNETHIRAFNKIVEKSLGLTSLHPLFEQCYFSNEIGLRKPDEEAFHFVLQQNDLLPSETLFIDDSIQHIEGANKCGLNTYHLKVEKETVESLFSNFLT